MQRCLELAEMGAASVRPNPMVGAILVYDNRIIGEGFHEVYGSHHAEVNCIFSVSNHHFDLIEHSTLYVSLEPCAHFGKTPPCTDLIIQKKIPRVVIGCRDPFHEVNGKGIEKLRAAQVDVICGVMEAQCLDVNRRFFTFHKLHRPYIVLKWAQTLDGSIGNAGNNRLLITNHLTNRLVHKWRSEEMAIMVGTNTAAMDNPQLTNRYWNGNDPVRVVLDMDLKLPEDLNIFDGKTRTVVFNLLKHGDDGVITYYQVAEDASMVHQVINGLRSLNITSVMIEGGAKLIQSFIDEALWDEARIITNMQLNAPAGVRAPELNGSRIRQEFQVGSDRIQWFVNEGVALDKSLKSAST